MFSAAALDPIVLLERLTNLSVYGKKRRSIFRAIDDRDDDVGRDDHRAVR